MAGFGGALYVGDLHPKVTEADIFEVFSSAGTVASVRVCRDAGTRTSLGYAYVNYHRVEDAEKALEKLNGTEVPWREASGGRMGGRKCRVMWSQRDPALRKSNVGNIFVKELPPNFDIKNLHDRFSKYGNILSCKVVYGKDGTSLGYGFVHYEAEEKALEAIEKENSQTTEKPKLVVSKFQPKRSRGAKSAKNFIFVRSIEAGTRDDELLEFFKKFKPVGVRTGFPRSGQTVVYAKEEGATEIKKVGKEQQAEVMYAFIYFETPEDAQKALEYNYAPFKSMKLRISAPSQILYLGNTKQNTEEQIPQILECTKHYVFVKNIQRGTTANEIMDLFKDFGPVGVRTGVPQIPDVMFASVYFTSAEQAHNALSLNGQNFKGREIDVSGRKEVYVGSIAAGTTEEELAELFAKTCGPVKNVYVRPCAAGATVLYFKQNDNGTVEKQVIKVPSEEEGGSKDCPVVHGYVTFQREVDAEKAVQQFKNFIFKSFVLFVAEKKSRKERQRARVRWTRFPESNVYIKNLPDNFDISSECAKFGTIISMRVVRNRSGQYKGRIVAFVCFANSSEAFNAISHLSQLNFNGIQVYAVKHQKKEDRVRMSKQVDQMPQQPGYMYAGYPQMQYPNMQQYARPTQRQVVPMSYYALQSQMPKYHIVPAVHQRPIIEQQRMIQRPRQMPYDQRKPRQMQTRVPNAMMRGQQQRALPPSIAAYLQNLQNYDPAQQKQILGENLFPFIQVLDGERAGKITGMLLEMDNTEIARLLFDEIFRQQKVTEAQDVLRSAEIASGESGA